MARFLVKASEFKNVCKAVNDRKLAELKKEIIEILKKQDEKEVKKAIDYFNSQELHYTHLEKSLISGKWIEKAGYGIGTVRIWKGKKYKKIAPGKWARVFDKEGRGTNIAIGKLIARVQKIDNVEDLMAFVMQNKQRFVDENGIDLPVLDKLRAAVDAKNNGEIESVSEQKTEKSKYEKLLKEFKLEVTNEKKRPTRELESDIKEWKDYIEHKDFGEEKTNYLKELVKVGESELERRKGTSKPAEKTDEKYDKELVDSWKDDYKDFSTDALKEKIEEYTKVLERAKNDNPSPDQRVAVKQNEHRLKALNELLEEKKNKPAEKENPVKLNHVVSPIEFTDNHGNKIRYEIDEVKNAPEDYQNPVRVYKVEGNVRTEIAGNVKNYEDAYSAVMEQVEKTKEGTTEKEKKYIDESIKTLPKEDSKGNKIEESKAEKKYANKDEAYKDLIQLGKDKSELLDNIKKRVADLAMTKEKKYNAEARGESTEELDSEIEKIQNDINDMEDRRAEIEFAGSKLVKEIDNLPEKEEKKVIENNPKSIEGMEFVNKNKMHVLANFLANHDNVNMATAVIRLQAAYERLGEEKFLSYFPKDVVERYRKEAGKEETKKESFTPISKDKMKSMSDDELKDYEAKLEKDLLATSRTDPDYVEKYNHWREVHGENNDRFHQRIEDEARAEKQAEADAKSAKDKEINEKYNGYFENRKGLDKARDLKTLEKKYNFDGKVMSSKEFVEQAMDNGAEIKEREVNKLDYPSRTRWNRMNGYEQDEYEKRIKAAGKKTVYSIDGYEFPKTVVDYAKFYKEKNGNVKKSAFDDFVMDMFIDEDEEVEDAIKTDELLFNDYSAEQPELFNSTSMKVREALDRISNIL